MAWAKYFEDNQDYFSENNYGRESALRGVDASGIVYSTGQMGYSSIEQTQKSPHHRRCINGQITGCGNCVGYCSFHEHPGYLTQQLRKEHNCIKKGCHYYRAKEKPTESQTYIAAALSEFVRCVKYAQIGG